MNQGKTNPTVSEQRGLNHFNSGASNCNTCHGGTLLSDNQFHFFGVHPTGDGTSDFSVFRSGDKNWYFQNGAGGKNITATNFGSNGDILTPADWDGDGKTDVAVYRDGIWYIVRSSDAQTGFGNFGNFGNAGDVPLPNVYVR